MRISPAAAICLATASTTLAFSTPTTTTFHHLKKQQAQAGSARQHARTFSKLYQSTPATEAAEAIVTGKDGKAASSKEEDLMLTMLIILDHEQRSTTASKEQFVQQMQQATTDNTDEDQVENESNVSVPYDAAARLAYESSNARNSASFEDFKREYETNTVELVKSKNLKATITTTTTTAEEEEVSDVEVVNGVPIPPSPVRTKRHRFRDSIPSCLSRRKDASGKELDQTILQTAIPNMINLGVVPELVKLLHT